MRKSTSIFLVALFVLCVTAVSITGYVESASALVSYNNYVNTTLPKEKCMAAAMNVLRSGQFTNITNSTYTVFGTRGSYQAFIRSIPEKQIAFICVFGPDAQECERFVNHLTKNGGW